MQREDDMCPVKLLLLALSAIRFFITFHVADGKSELNWLLETLSTCRGRSVVDKYGTSGSSPLRRLKLTSRTMMLPDDMSSIGRPLEKELCERLTRRMLVRSARHGKMLPLSPLDARETSVTTPSSLQMMPSYSQQPVSWVMAPRRGEGAVRNWRSACFSCSVHEVAGETNESSRSSCSMARRTVKARVFCTSCFAAA
ncbi:hypothetical protein VPH35_109986 [Triticum aestivum]